METSNALQVIPGGHQQLEVMRPPEVVLSEARRAATALADVLSRKPKKIELNGKRLLEFDDWQTIGRFYSVGVRTHDSEPVDVQGVKGAKARADVIDMKTGNIIGGAEAYCMKDEKNWSNKPWFQLASMAQTRAGSKALKNVLSWVVVLAGCSATPAEEMGGDYEDHQPPVPQLPSASQIGSIKKITEPQQKRLFALLKASGKTADELKRFLIDQLGVEHSKDISMTDYEFVCSWVQGN